jgi:N-acetylglucosamine-6-phosphate deacetylase
LDRALANAVEAGLSLPEASALLSANPADALGRTDVGRLAPGAFADIVELDAELTVVRVFRGGVEVPR